MEWAHQIQWPDGLEQADRNSHEPVIGRDVEQFLTIAAPLYKTTALNSTPL
jgi:hypothetical protein